MSDPDRPVTGTPERRYPRVARISLIGFAVLACSVVVGALVIRHTLVLSLPLTTGSHVLPGLRAPVQVERDVLGIATIRGRDRIDVARATGFVHAQDRFFQMDATRRFAAGELSDLVGPAAIANDKANRVHRLRAVARDALARATPGERALLQAYADGVNAGLHALGARPPEYLLLGSEPASWQAEDSLLVLGAMFGNDLENSARERELDEMYARLPAAVVDFLRPLGDQWDAPLAGSPMVPPPIPGPEVFVLRGARAATNEAVPQFTGLKPCATTAWRTGLLPRFAGLKPCATSDLSEPAGSPEATPRATAQRAGAHEPLDAVPGERAYGSTMGGSNAWASAASHTADGRAVVANDPHLPLQVPNIWYRLVLEWPDAQETWHRMAGASLPGLPFVAIGSNGHVAWGFTVAFDDRSDMVIVETEGLDSPTYRTPEGPRTFDHVVESIKVKGERDLRLDITSTVWGPVVGQDAHGRPLAMEWQAHHPDGINFTFAHMEDATTVDQALDVANRSRLPSYNIVVADDRGSIGWTVTGGLPRRVGFDGRVPTSWADGTRYWDGWLQPADYPRIVNPPSGRLWTSNNRPLDRPLLDRLGLEGYIMGPRARQVRDDLMAHDRMTPRDSLRIQLDDRAIFLGRWRTFLLDELRDEKIGGQPRRREFRQLVADRWDGRASATSVGYLLVERFRIELARLVIGPFAPGLEKSAFRPGAIIEWWESAVWRLVHERPPHLLAPQWTDWDEVTRAAVDATIRAVTADGRALAAASWGTTTLPIAHPIGRAAPWLGRWLNMPWVALPGDTNVPRVRMPSAAGNITATLRMAVSPGHEETGIFHMPTGQSGHPLSPHYRDMESDWVEGRATPFLPGPPTQTLTLLPR